MCLLSTIEKANARPHEHVDAMCGRARSPIPTRRWTPCSTARGLRHDAGQRRPRQRQAMSPFFCSRVMNDRTDLADLAEARDGLREEAFSALELTDAHLAAIEKARALNAYVLETPEQARAHGEGRPTRGSPRARRGPLEGMPLGIKDLFCTKGVRTTACSQHPRQFHADLRIDRHRQSLARRRGDARQAQQGRVRHGLVERDLVLRPGGQSRGGAKGSNTHAGAGRLVRRLGRGGGGASVPRRDRHRHRRLDPPAGGLHRHRRHQADLRPLLALGHRRLRLVARPGRADRAHGARRRDPAALDGGPRSEGHHVGRSCRCRTTRRRSASRSRA